MELSKFRSIPKPNDSDVYATLHLIFHQDKMNIDNILKQHSNKQCVDCRALNPEWVSLSYGVFVCLTCSRLHTSIGQVKSAFRETWSPEQLKPIQLGGNRRFKDYLSSYDLLGHPFAEVYYSKAAEYYRQLLKAEALERPMTFPPPSAIEGVKHYTRVPIISYEFNRPVIKDPLEEDNSWLGSAWNMWGSVKNKATTWASGARQKAIEYNIVDTMKAGAAGFVDRTKEAYGKVKESDTLKKVSYFSQDLLTNMGNNAMLSTYPYLIEGTPPNELPRPAPKQPQEPVDFLTGEH